MKSEGRRCDRPSLSPPLEISKDLGKIPTFLGMGLATSSRSQASPFTCEQGYNATDDHLVGIISCRYLCLALVPPCLN